VIEANPADFAVTRFYNDCIMTFPRCLQINEDRSADFYESWGFGGRLLEKSETKGKNGYQAQVPAFILLLFLVMTGFDS
jgi:hypothetical protein